VFRGKCTALNSHIRKKGKGLNGRTLKEKKGKVSNQHPSYHLKHVGRGEGAEMKYQHSKQAEGNTILNKNQ
jgi:hypothetical protein